MFAELFGVEIRGVLVEKIFFVVPFKRYRSRPGDLGHPVDLDLLMVFAL